MDYYKNVYKGYFIQFFHNLIPAYVIERLYWQKRGMTVFDVVLCEIIYAITIVIAEIPTGIIADKFSRKSLLIFGAVLSVLEFVLLLYAHYFWMFALVVFLAGIASACTSGAFNALLYDSLLRINKEDSFEKIVGRLNSLDFMGSLLAALSGSVLAKWYGFELNYVLSAISMVISLFMTILLNEPTTNKVQKQNVKSKIFVHSITFYKSNPKLIFLILNAMAIGACVSYLDEFWQLYLEHSGFSILYFGVFSACISLSRIPGNLIAATIGRRFQEKTIIIFILGLSAAGFFMTALFPGWLGIAIILIIFLCSGVVDPLITGYLHHHTDSEIRATVESMQSLIERAIMFLVGIGFGVISSKVSVIAGFVFLGAVTGLFFLIFCFKVGKGKTS